MDITISVYTQRHCQACRATKRLLDELNVPYEEHPAQENFVLLFRHHITTAPGVIVSRGGDVVDAWGGYRPDRIRRYAPETAAEESRTA
jgi:glutaredoxin